MKLAQVQINLPRAQAHAAAVLGWRGDALADSGLVCKTVLSEALGGPVLRPWRIERVHGGIATVLGYSEADLSTADALPSAQAAVTAMGSVPVEIRDGELQTYGLRICPVVHVTPREGRRHGERDAFLVAIDAEPQRQHDRLSVYAAYLAARLPGAELVSVEATQDVRLLRVFRPRADRSLARKTIPDISLVGRLRVTDAAALVEVMRHGIGGHRAYGYGMLRLAAPR